MTTSPIDPHIIRSLPALHVERLTPRQLELWSALSPSYQEFLRARNGGIVKDDGRHDFCFRTQVPYFKDNVQTLESNIDSVTEFYGFRSQADDARALLPDTPRLPQDLAAVRAEHHSREFLPRGVIAIAEAHESLVCISTRREDHGAVYYWDYYWDYPWSQQYFAPRLAAVERSFPDLTTIQKEPKHPQRQEAVDALNYATLVFLASDFGTWLRSCWWGELDE